MISDYALAACPAILPLLVGVSVATSALRRRHWSGAALLLLFALLVVVWSLSRGLQSASLPTATILVYRRVEESCATLAPPLWLLFTIGRFGFGEERASQIAVGVVTLPLLWLGGTWTGSTPAHSLWQIGALTYALLSLGLALGMGLNALLKSGPRYRRRSAPHIIASLLMLAAVALYGLDRQTPTLRDVSALTATLTGTLMSWSFLRSKPSQLSPLARASVIEEMTDGVLVLDANHVIIDMNPAARTLLWGDRSILLLGRPVSEILPMTADSIELETPSGLRCLELRVTSLRSPLGSPRGYLVVLHDSTDVERARRDLASQNARLDLVFEATGDSAWDWMPETDELYLSPHLYLAMGYALTEIPYTLASWRKLVHPDDVPDLDLIVSSIRAGDVDYIQRDFRLVNRAGDWQWVHVRGRVIDRSPDGRTFRVVGVHSDAGSQRSSEAIMSYRALYDELTAIPNRFLLLDRLRLELARSTREGTAFAVAFCDLNEFKEVNDTYGHAGGDELLRQVAKRLTVCVRETDTVARMGGDEFVLLLTGQTGDIEAAEMVAKRVVQHMAEPFVLEGRRIKVSLSMGIAIGPEHGASVESLMKSADIAMYAAKTKGVSRYVFFSPQLLNPTTGTRTERMPIVPSAHQETGAASIFF